MGRELNILYLLFAIYILFILGLGLLTGLGNAIYTEIRFHRNVWQGCHVFGYNSLGETMVSECHNSTSLAFVYTNTVIKNFTTPELILINTGGTNSLYLYIQDAGTYSYYNKT